MTDGNRIVWPDWVTQRLTGAIADLSASPDEKWDDVEITVHKHVMHVPYSTDYLMDEGLIPDTRPPVVITRRDRIRWASQDRIHRLRLRVGSWIAGESLDRDDE